MKFHMTAIDGDFELDHKAGDGWEMDNLKYWEPAGSCLVATDGVNVAYPVDPEAEALVARMYRKSIGD